MLGRPAASIKCTLYHLPASSEIAALAEGTTNSDGRVAAWDKTLVLQENSDYKIRFETEPYFKGNGVDSFFPYVEIAFTVKSTNEHYHVPVLLAPWSFSTYRGS